MIELSIGSTDKGADWLGFISKMTEALAWPLAIVIIAIMFRRPLVRIFQKIRKLSYGDTSIEFEIEKAEEQLQDAIPQQLPEVDRPAIDTRFEQLLKISPEAAVTDAWKPIESELRRISDGLGYDEKRSLRALSVLSRLVQQNLIRPEVADLVNELRNIRNLAAHSADVSPDTALRFYDMSAKVLKELKAVQI